MIETAIILCGGKGTRFLPISKKIPKPLIKVNGKCLIDYQIDTLIKYGITHIIFALGYQSKKVARHLGKRFSSIKPKSSIQFTYMYEKEPLGTGGAIKGILTNTYLLKSDRFFVLNCDNIIDINLWKMQKLKGTVIAGALAQQSSRFGELQNVLDPKIRHFRKYIFLQKPRRMLIAHAGYCIFTKEDAQKICPIKGPYEENLNRIIFDVYLHRGYFYPIDSQNDIENYLLKNRKA